MAALVTLAREQPAPRKQRGFDLRIAGQDGRIGHAEALSRLAFGEQEIIDALFAHDPGGFFRDGQAQHFSARIRSLAAHAHAVVSLIKTMSRHP